MGLRDALADLEADAGVDSGPGAGRSALLITAPVADALDEDQLLEALIREEEDSTVATPAAGEESAGLSVEELQSFTLDDVEPLDDDEELDDEGELEDVLPELPDLAALAPDAGKIRFAEDLIEDRGGRGGHCAPCGRLTMPPRYRSGGAWRPS